MQSFVEEVPRLRLDEPGLASNGNSSSRSVNDSAWQKHECACSYQSKRYFRQFLGLMRNKSYSASWLEKLCPRLSPLDLPGPQKCKMAQFLQTLGQNHLGMSFSNYLREHFTRNNYYKMELDNAQLGAITCDFRLSRGVTCNQSAGMLLNELARLK